MDAGAEEIPSRDARQPRWAVVRQIVDAGDSGTAGRSCAALVDQQLYIAGAYNHHSGAGGVLHPTHVGESIAFIGPTASARIRR